ncbi:Protein of uncharacterised function (DUF2786) [Mycobacteroides abscessus]|nr:Protein of uncharacterised function (DUF2786) [Mycobacteroides abscessus]
MSLVSPNLAFVTEDKQLSRIAALLRQAEGTDNTHEAEAFMAAAQRLATATSIDLAVARAHSAKRDAQARPTQRTITIGEAGTRCPRASAGRCWVWARRCVSGRPA